MNIGDVWFGAHLDNSGLTVDAKKGAAAAADAAGKTYTQRMSATIKKGWSGAEIGKGLAQGLGLAGGLGAAHVLASGIGIVQDVIGGAISKASDLGESMSKTKVVFGESADAMVKWSSTAARTMGLSQQAALEASSTIGNLLLSMGKTPPVAAEMSRKMVGLAADLASFNNVDIEEVLTAMRSGLTGEISPLRRFGVNLSDATLKAKAMALGLSDGTGVLDAGAKSQAAYALILEQTTTAQGDFARTSDGLANKQRTLNAAIDDLEAQLGTALLPVVTDATDWFLRLVEAINDTGAAARDNKDPIDNLANVIHDIFKSPDEDARSFFGALGDGLNQLDANVSDAAGGINDFWTFWDDHSELAERRARRAGTLFDHSGDAAEAMRGRVGDALAATRIEMNETGDDTERMRGRIGDALGISAGYYTDAAGEIVKIGGASRRARSANALNATAISKSWKDVRDDIVGYANDLIDQAFNPLITYDDLTADNLEVLAARRTLALKGATKDQKEAAREEGQARKDLAEAIKDEGTARKELNAKIKAKAPASEIESARDALAAAVEGRQEAARQLEEARDAIVAAAQDAKDAKRQADADLALAMQSTARHLLTLAQGGTTTGTAFVTGLANLKTFNATLTGPSHDALAIVIGQIDTLVATAKKGIPPMVARVTVQTTYSSTSGPHATTKYPNPLDPRNFTIYDSGGRPDPFVPALIGRGPYQEMFIPDRPGTIIPHTDTEAIKSATGGNTYNFTVALPTTARPDPFETAAQLRRLADFGVFAK